MEWVVYLRSLLLLLLPDTTYARMDAHVARSLASFGFSFLSLHDASRARTKQQREERAGDRSGFRTHTNRKGTNIKHKKNMHACKLLISIPPSSSSMVVI